MSRQILALDIRTSHLSAVLLTTGIKNATISRCIHIPFAEVPAEDQENAVTPLARALTTLRDQMTTSGAEIVVSLPMDQIIFRSLLIPFNDDSKIRQVLPFELEPIVPVDIDRLTIDFQKLPVGEQSQVFAVAINNDALAHHLDLLNTLEMPPQLVVPGGFPLALQISQLDVQEPGHTLILEIDQAQTTIFALIKGHIALVRTIPSDLSTENGAESLGLRIRQTLIALGEDLADGFSPAAVYVSGPGLELEESVTRLSNTLDLPVGTIDFRRLLTNVDMDNSVQWDPHRYNDALSLAYLDAEGGKCPNFHRVRSPLRSFWTAYRPFIMGPALLLLVALILGLAGVFMDSYDLKRTVSRQKQQMAQVFQSTFPNTRLTAPPLDQMKSKLKEAQKDNLATEFKAPPVKTIDILLELSRRVPPAVDVVLSRMTVGGMAVTVSGETADFNTVDDIKGRIEKSAYFKNVTIASANMDKSGKKVRFKLKIDL